MAGERDMASSDASSVTNRSSTPKLFVTCLECDMEFESESSTLVVTSVMAHSQTHPYGVLINGKTATDVLGATLKYALAHLAESEKQQQQQQQQSEESTTTSSGIPPEAYEQVTQALRKYPKGMISISNLMSELGLRYYSVMTILQSMADKKYYDKEDSGSAWTVIDTKDQDKGGSSTFSKWYLSEDQKPEELPRWLRYPHINDPKERQARAVAALWGYAPGEINVSQLADRAEMLYADTLRTLHELAEEVRYEEDRKTPFTIKKVDDRKLGMKFFKAALTTEEIGKKPE